MKNIIENGWLLSGIAFFLARRKKPYSYLKQDGRERHLSFLRCLCHLCVRPGPHSVLLLMNVCWEVTVCKGLLHMWAHLLFVITWGQLTVTKGNSPAKGSSQWRQDPNPDQPESTPNYHPPRHTLLSSELVWLNSTPRSVDCYWWEVDHHTASVLAEVCTGTSCFCSPHL